MATYKLTRLEDITETKPALGITLTDALLALLCVLMLVTAVFVGLKAGPEKPAENCDHIEYLAGQCAHE